jgi:hypothetical protein
MFPRQLPAFGAMMPWTKRASLLWEIPRSSGGGGEDGKAPSPQTRSIFCFLPTRGNPSRAAGGGAPVTRPALPNSLRNMVRLGPAAYSGNTGVVGVVEGFATGATKEARTAPCLFGASRWRGLAGHHAK